MEKKYYAVSWEDRDENGNEMSKGMTIFGGTTEECQEVWKSVIEAHHAVFLRKATKEEFMAFQAYRN